MNKLQSVVATGKSVFDKVETFTGKNVFRRRILLTVCGIQN